MVKCSSNTVLWCNGLRKKASNKKGAMQSTDTSSEDDEEEIQETVKKRAKSTEEVEVGEPRKKRKVKKRKCEQHLISSLESIVTTPMQYHMLAEMYVGGVHLSLDDPRTSSMFNRASGGGSVKRKTGQTSEVISAISDLTSALTPKLIPIIIAPQVVQQK